MSHIEVQLELHGVVQGVGFRPCLARLVRAAGLGGWCRNQSGSVRLVLQGDADRVTTFLATLPRKLPPAARLQGVRELERRTLNGEPQAFAIHASTTDEPAAVTIGPDLVMCAACRVDVEDPDSRFFSYPFTTCTDCGPRFTIVRAMPYDRQRTSLSGFALCAHCQRDYDDPSSRRYHAEGLACPACGPSLSLQHHDGRQISGPPLVEARAALGRGSILAVKGLGGFQLVVDAANGAAIKRLRQRKQRPRKPLALMARDLATVRACCLTSAAEETLLTSPEGPIVVMQARQPHVPAMDQLTPGQDTVAIMLATTPLHLLLTSPDHPLLVVTSCNRRGEPMETEPVGAVDMADLLLTHDRPIVHGCDDSLAAVQGGVARIWRRARGHVPLAIELQRPLDRCVLAMGAELKNAPALGWHHKVIPGPHIGDLGSPRSSKTLHMAARHWPAYLSRDPEVIAVDLHPDMHATRLGEALAAELGLPLVRVQHHHAHAMAAMAEHGLEDSLALVFDGAGLGDDGTIWGAELLAVRRQEFIRLATFAPSRLLGGDVAISQPARQLLARWRDAGVRPKDDWLTRRGISQADARTWAMQWERGLNAPLSHAAGRVFDAWSALLGIAPVSVDFEGEAAILLEAVARRATSSAAVPFHLTRRGGLLMVDWAAAFDRGPPPPEQAPALALGVHQATAAAATAMLTHGRERCGDLPVVLTGGVMQNRLLLDLLVPMLRQQGFAPHLPEQIPPNDGGLALGQVVIAGA